MTDMRSCWLCVQKVAQMCQHSKRRVVRQLHDGESEVQGESEDPVYS